MEAKGKQNNNGNNDDINSCCMVLKQKPENRSDAEEGIVLIPTTPTTGCDAYQGKCQERLTPPLTPCSSIGCKKCVPWKMVTLL